MRGHRVRTEHNGIPVIPLMENEEGLIRPLPLEVHRRMFRDALPHGSVVTIGVPGDGSCLLHSFMCVTNPAHWVRQSTQHWERYIRPVREAVAQLHAPGTFSLLQRQFEDANNYTFSETTRAVRNRRRSLSQATLRVLASTCRINIMLVDNYGRVLTWITPGFRNGPWAVIAWLEYPDSPSDHHFQPLLFLQDAGTDHFHACGVLPYQEKLFPFHSQANAQLTKHFQRGATHSKNPPTFTARAVDAGEQQQATQVPATVQRTTHRTATTGSSAPPRQTQSETTFVV